jgi:hypothetical protein
MNVIKPIGEVMKADSKHRVHEGSQVIEITESFTFNKRTLTFIAELSEIRTGATRQVSLRNPKTGVEKLFILDRTDTDKSGEDVYGWHYKSEDGTMKMLLIND